MPGRGGAVGHDAEIALHLYFPFKKEPRGLGAVEGLSEYDVNPDVVYVRVSARPISLHRSHSPTNPLGTMRCSPSLPLMKMTSEEKDK